MEAKEAMGSAMLAAEMVEMAEKAPRRRRPSGATSSPAVARAEYAPSAALLHGRLSRWFSHRRPDGSP